MAQKSEELSDLPRMPNASDLCRLCLDSGANKIEIFGEIGQQMNISKTMKILFNSQVLQDDNWPQNICMPCCEKLTEFHKFYSTVKSTEATLVGICGAQSTPDLNFNAEDEKTHLEFIEITPEVNVKVEVPEDPEDLRDKTLLKEVKKVSPRIKCLPKAPKANNPTKEEPELPNNKSKKESMDTAIAKIINLTCDLCMAKFKVFENLLLHFQKVHKQEGYVTCCNITFRQRQRLVDHVNYHKNPQKYACKLCGKGFMFRNSLSHHMDLHVAPEERRFKCNQCPKSYNMQCRLTLHQKIHIPPEEREYKCTQCNKTYVSIYTLRSHISTVHQRSLKKVCEVCAKIFHSREGFQAHMLKHTGQPQEKMRCAHCDREYMSRASLRRHMENHKATQCYSCDICGQEFKTKHRMRIHRSGVHSDKVFKCNLCPKVFKRSLNLKEHLATHSGQQLLYKCNFCDKMFNSNANRYVHQKKNHPIEWEKERKEKLDKSSSSNDVGSQEQT